MIAGSVYTYVPRAYDRRTVDFHYVDSDFVEQYPRWSATQIMSVRSSIVVRGTCDRNKSVYDAVLRTLLAYATQGNHNPCRTVCWHWLSRFSLYVGVSVERCLSAAILHETGREVWRRGVCVNG